MRVTNTSARLHIFHTDILPGQAEDVPEEFEEALRKSPAFRAGELVEGPVSMPKPRTTGLKGLRDVSIPKAIAMINAESDLETLRSWADSEERGAILGALEARVKAL